MEKLFAPHVSLAAGVEVGLVNTVDVLAVLLGFWLDLQGVFGHEQTERQGR